LYPPSIPNANTDSKPGLVTSVTSVGPTGHRSIKPRPPKQADPFAPTPVAERLSNIQTPFTLPMMVYSDPTIATIAGTRNMTARGNTADGLELLLARRLESQVGALGKQLAGVREGQLIECIHQARVASRRARAALGLLADVGPPRKVRRWRKHVGRLTRDLGLARDADVQIAFIHEYCASLDDQTVRPGLERLALRLRQRRENAQPAVVEAVDRFEASKALEEMTRYTAKRLRWADRCDATASNAAVRRSAKANIASRVKKAMAIAPCLEQSDDHGGHHAMRIAFKRLRYTMEIYEPAFGKPMTGIISPVKQLQTLLGRIHDCDVWVESLDAFEQAERARVRDHFGHDEPMIALGKGLDHLRADRRALRAKLLPRTAKRWQKMAKKGLWDDLNALFKAPPGKGR